MARSAIIILLDPLHEDEMYRYYNCVLTYRLLKSFFSSFDRYSHHQYKLRLFNKIINCVVKPTAVIGFLHIWYSRTISSSYLERSSSKSQVEKMKIENKIGNSKPRKMLKWDFFCIKNPSICFLGVHLHYNLNLINLA